MKQNVWIMNHHASKMFYNEGGRHYWISEILKKQGYNPVVFCCNAKRDVPGETYMPKARLWSEYVAKSEVPFVYIESTPYKGNGVSRIRNMIHFARNLVKVGKEYAKIKGKPDVIIASSVHPFTVFAGEKLAKYFNVPCICEIRDLWPESIFAYYPNRRKAPYAKLLYWGEKLMYKKSDAIVMTWEGGAQYIREQGWSNQIPDNKITHISNGVFLEGFIKNKVEHPCEDSELLVKDSFYAVYTGAIKKVNNVQMLLDAARIIQQRGNVHNVKILVWGDGDKYEELREQIERYNLTNFALKGRVAKQKIPAILSEADCCILHNSSTELDKYGQSQNKFFEYLASGKPVLMTYTVGFSIIEKYKCGVELMHQTPEDIANALESMAEMSQKDRDIMGKNSAKAAIDFDFLTLTKKYIQLIESL